MISLSLRPTAHPNLFQQIPVRASSRVTPPSPWPWVDRPVSGLLPATKRPFQTRFRYASPSRLSLPLRSKSLTHYTKGTQSPLEGSHCLYADGFRFYCTPLSGFFSPFPHGTGSLSVGQEYLALEDGPPMFRQDITCPALLVFTRGEFSCTGLSPCAAPFQHFH